MNTDNNLLLRHLLTQSVFPSTDKEMYVAYLILNKRWPEIRLWSMDGYHADAIVSYKERLLLDDRGLRKWMVNKEHNSINQEFPNSPEIHPTLISKLENFSMQKYLKE